MNTLQFINGEWVAAIDNGSIKLINPATEEIIETISYGNDKDCNAAIESAQATRLDCSQSLAA